MTTEITEILVIGAGPIGIEMAVALKRAGMDFIHVEAKQIGATIQWWAPGTRWFSSNERISIAGVPLMTPDQTKATREQYLAYLRAVVTQFDLHVRAYEPVTRIQRTDDGFVVTTNPRAGARTVRCRKIILCTGGTERPRTLGIPGEDSSHVSSYFQDPHTYFGQNLLIVGGKNSAVEAALRSHLCGARVSISYRHSALPAKHIKYWLTPEITGLMSSGRITGHFDTVPVEIKPASVVLKCTNTGKLTEVPADFVLMMIGYLADMSLCKLAGVELVGEQSVPLYDETTMQTNVPGIFIAGTAVAGTQMGYRVFLENCHVHVERIMAALQGRHAPAVHAPNAMPET